MVRSVGRPVPAARLARRVAGFGVRVSVPLTVVPSHCTGRLVRCRHSRPSVRSAQASRSCNRFQGWNRRRRPQTAILSSGPSPPLRPRSSSCRASRCSRRGAGRQGFSAGLCRFGMGGLDLSGRRDYVDAAAPGPGFERIPCRRHDMDQNRARGGHRRATQLHRPGGHACRRWVVCRCRDPRVAAHRKGDENAYRYSHRAPRPDDLQMGRLFRRVSPNQTNVTASVTNSSHGSANTPAVVPTRRRKVLSCNMHSSKNRIRPGP